MPDLERRFQPNRDEVAAKVMDGEAIIINLSTGVYYSMDKAGSLIWDLIEGESSLEEIIERLISQYDVLREQAQADVENLAAQLIEEKLIVESNNHSGSAPKEETAQTKKISYESPKLNIYRDMGDLLALDPPMPGLEKLP